MDEVRKLIQNPSDTLCTGISWQGTDAWSVSTEGVVRVISACRRISKHPEIKSDFVIYYYSSRLKSQISQSLFTVADEAISLQWPSKGSQLTGRRRERLEQKPIQNGALKTERTQKIQFCK